MSGSETDIFIQWKGTDACLELRCECGQTEHRDGMFLYHVKCIGCGSWYELPSAIHPRKLNPQEAKEIEEEMGRE